MVHGTLIIEIVTHESSNQGFKSAAFQYLVKRSRDCSTKILINSEGLRGYYSQFVDYWIFQLLARTRWRDSVKTLCQTELW